MFALLFLFVIIVFVLIWGNMLSRKREYEALDAKEEMELAKEWMLAHPNHALSQQVEAACMQLYSNLEVTEQERLVRLGTIFANARRMQLEIDPNERKRQPAKTKFWSWTS